MDRWFLIRPAHSSPFRSFCLLSSGEKRSWMSAARTTTSSTKRLNHSFTNVFARPLPASLASTVTPPRWWNSTGVVTK
jgi:hypothetical protein